MPKTNALAKAIPAQVNDLLVQMGEYIRTARLRRKLRLVDLANRIGISRFVLADIEKGKATTAVGGYISALWALGLTDKLQALITPDNDIEGKILENSRAPKTAPKRHKVLDNDF